MEVTANNNISWMLRKIVAYKTLLDSIGDQNAISKQQNFTIKDAYKKLRGDCVKVDWRRLICNNKATPRSKFILWPILLDRLDTSNRLNMWNSDISPMCRICDQQIESTHHLFFKCSYNTEVWKQVLSFIHWQPQSNPRLK